MAIKVSKSTMSTRQRTQVDYTLGMCYSCNGIYDFDSDGRKRELLKCFDCHRNGRSYFMYRT
ncbi:hypothetical protein BDF21DRAFT_215900 [Thamnidium elegans]|nr:hypothetical protein BDF21DRAFT_215900 [Thamnidium elegans]